MEIVIIVLLVAAAIWVVTKMWKRENTVQAMRPSLGHGVQYLVTRIMRDAGLSKSASTLP